MAEGSRVPIPGSDKRPVSNAERIGDVHPDERLEVTVHLRSKAESVLAQQVQQLATRAPHTREHLSREAFAQQFGASPADISKVEAFAQAHGLAVVASSAARRSVVLSGTAGQISDAFGVELVTYAHPDGGSFRGRQGPIYIPGDLANVVQGVFGIDDRPAARAHLRRLSDVEGIQPRAA